MCDTEMFVLQRAILDYRTRLAMRQRDWKEVYGLTLACFLDKDWKLQDEATNLIPGYLKAAYNQKPRPRALVSYSHAEGNLISQIASSKTLTTEGGCVIINRFPCVVCANALVQAKVALLVAPKPDYGYKPECYAFEDAMDILVSSGIVIIEFDFDKD